MTQPPAPSEQPDPASGYAWNPQFGGPPVGPAPGARPKRKVWKIVLAISILGFLLCCGAGVVVFNFLKDSVGEAFGPIREDTSAFMDAVVRDDTATAYGKFCSAGKERYSEQQFAERVHRYQGLTGYTIVNSFVTNVNGTQSGRVTVELKDASGSHQVQLDMVKEDGHWKVCGDPF